MHYTTLLACILAFVVAVMTIYAVANPVQDSQLFTGPVLGDPFYSGLFGLTAALLTMMVIVLIHRLNNRDLPVSSLGVMLWISAFVMVVCDLLFSSDPFAYPFRTADGATPPDTNIATNGYGALVGGSLTVIYLGLIFFLPEKWHNKWLPVSAR